MWLPFSASERGFAKNPDSDRSSKVHVNLLNGKDWATYVLAALCVVILVSPIVDVWRRSVRRVPTFEVVVAPAEENKVLQNFPFLDEMPEGHHLLFVVGAAGRRPRPNFQLIVKTNEEYPNVQLTKALIYDVLTMTSQGYVRRLGRTNLSKEQVIATFPKGRANEIPVLLLALDPNGTDLTKLRREGKLKELIRIETQSISASQVKEEQ